MKELELFLEQVEERMGILRKDPTEHHISILSELGLVKIRLKQVHASLIKEQSKK